MVSEQQIQLGYRVQDRISGFTGIVTDIGTHISGCTRFGVMPDNDEKDDRRGETEFFYAAQLEILAENTTFHEEYGQSAVTEVDIELGDAVEDDITGFSGIATTITYNLYNCPRVAIQPTTEAAGILPGDTGDDDIDREWFDAPCVNRLNDGISAEYESLVNTQETATTGASDDVSRKEDKR